jgi:uncharacterized membrane protein
MKITPVSGVPRRRVFGPLLLAVVVVAGLILSSSVALAAPRSGGSFGGRSFRSSGGFGSSRSTSRNYGYSGGGSHFFFLPSFGWGGLGYGGGGFGSLMVVAVLGFAAFSLVRAARRYRSSSGGGWGAPADDDDVAPDRAYVYRMQVALGRSARGIQDRLARFATEGDTSSEAGLASMLQQTALELMREKDSIRAAAVDASGPMSFTNAETKMNGLALAERSRFQVERVRGADGNVRRSQVEAEEGKEALEFVVVTMVVATRTPIGKWKGITDRSDLDLYLGQVGGVSSTGLLGLEVVWTPADPNDSMTETDLMTTYPDLRSL